MRAPRIGLRARIGIAILSTIALLLIVVVGGGVRLVQTQRQQTYVIDDFYAALRSSQAYFINMLDTETAVRGYELTREESALDPMRKAGTPESANLVQVVQASVPQETQLIAKARDMDLLGRRWYYGWAVPTVATIRAGGTLSDGRIDEGKAQFDEFRVAYEDYITVARSQRAVANDQLRALTNKLFFAVLAEVLIAAIAAFMLWRLLRRWVNKPMAELAGEVRTVSGGAFEHAVTTTGPPEFVALGQDVERMRKLLVEQIAQVEAAGVEIREAHARLEQQAEDLQRSNRDLEQFAYVASHDLQEPLRKVASFCQLLQRRYADQLDERADQYIHFAVDGAKRMQQLINDLLDFSRVGRQAAEMSTVSMEECLAQALGHLESAVEASGAEVTSDPLPEVRGERGLLVQLLQNLIGNAIKFRSEDAPRVHIGVRQTGARWEFTCSDNGIGIDPAYSERVFMIFQRLHPKDEYTGTGIGLALCKRIVEYHGGRIWIVDDHEEGLGGTTIRWTIPAAAETPVRAPVDFSTARGAAPSGATRSVAG
ncbi:ATP-binding protein [Spongisporangium articulatum]|uniref:histidine kinase n=1 Tax=Spongisporangium articulatum TaxID=3362603 RepID=A0ABW8AR26_9ACTN